MPKMRTLITGSQCQTAKHDLEIWRKRKGPSFLALVIKSMAQLPNSTGAKNWTICI